MMKIDQTYIDENVIEPMMKRFDSLGKSIEKIEKKINITQQSLNYLQKYMKIKKVK